MMLLNLFLQLLHPELRNLLSKLFYRKRYFAFAKKKVLSSQLFYTKKLINSAVLQLLHSELRNLLFDYFIEKINDIHKSSLGVATSRTRIIFYWEND